MMRLSALILIGVLWGASAPAQAAGLQLINVPADSAGESLAGAVWSPCAAPAREVSLNEFLVQGVKDCPVAGDKLPLVVISHGRAGWFGAHHDTAASLADAGFVVVAINHPGDNTFDRSRVDDLSIALSRPADVGRAIDFMLGAWPQAAKIDRERIGIYGYSRGGYTGLAVIGGQPNFARGAARCAELTGLRACQMFAKNAIPAQVITHDPRIKAAVIADPGFMFLFGPADLKAVTVPVQLWSSERGGDGVTPQSTAALGQKLAAPPDYRLAHNAGHFAFLAPCSPELASAAPGICRDAEGFDRAAFHREFNAEVLAFLRKHLAGSGTP
jgi:predicted dienelactone hydrolase